MDQSRQQTAVGYIEDNLKNVKEGYQNIVLGGEEYVNIKHLKYLIEQARQMEKEQILDAIIINQNGLLRRKTIIEAEKYYNETYNKDEKK